MTTILIKKKDTAGAPAPGDLTNAAGGTEIAVNTATKRIYTKDSAGNVVELGTNGSATTLASLTVTGATALNGTVALGDAAADNITVNGTITSNLIFTDNTYDIGASGATRPRSLFVGTNGTFGGRLALAGASIDASYAINAVGSIQTTGDAKGLRLLNTATNGGGTILANTGAAGGILIGGDSGPILFQTGATTYIKLETSGQATFTGPIVESLTGTTASNGIANASFNNGRNTLAFYPQLLNGGYNGLVQVNDYGIILSDTSGSGYNYGLVVGKHNGSAIRFAAGSGNMQFGINSAVVAQLSTVALGIGRAPNTAWGSNWNAVELGGVSGGVFASVAGTALVTNAYNDNTNWRRIGAGGSFYIGTGQGNMTWYTASATAGGSGVDSIISYTQQYAMTVDGYNSFASIAAFNGASLDTSYGVSSANGFKSVGTDRGLRLVNSTGTGGGTISANTGSAGGVTIGADSGTLFLQGGGSTKLTVGSTQVQTLIFNSTAVDYGAPSPSGLAGWNDNVNTVTMYARLNGGNYSGIVVTGDSALIQTQTSPDYGFVVGKHNGAAIRFGSLGTGLNFAVNSSSVGRWTSTGLVIGASNTPTVSLLQVGAGNYNANTAVATIGTSNAAQPALVLSNWTGVAGTNSPYIGFDHSGVAGWSVGPANSGGGFRTVNGSITSTVGTLVDSGGKFYLATGGLTWDDPFGVGVFAARGPGHVTYMGTSATGGYAVLILQREAASSGDMIYFRNTSGLAGTVLTAGLTTSYITTSDYRLKKNVQSLSGAMSRIMSVKPCSYDWINDDSYGEGFIAHELAEKFPLAVSGVKDELDHEDKPKYQGIDSAKLVPALVAAFQELKNDFDAYKASHP